MENVLQISNMILQIIDNGKIINLDKDYMFNNVEGFNQDIELFNVILSAHKKRYKECYSDDNRAIEVKNYLDDCRMIFEPNILSDDLIKTTLLLSVCDNFKSLEFREICVSLMEQIKTCGMYQMRSLLYQQVINYIINFRLYVQEPFISILREFTTCLDEIKTEYGIIQNQLFLG